jgi:hypothetical protein
MPIWGKLDPCEQWPTALTRDFKPFFFSISNAILKMKCVPHNFAQLLY